MMRSRDRIALLYGPSASLRSFVLLIGTLLLASGCGPARRSEPIAPPLQIRSESVAKGETVFTEHCNECHPKGEAGLGPALNNKPLPEWLIRFQVRHGLGAMPSFSEKEISDRQLNDVVAYLKALR